MSLMDAHKHIELTMEEIKSLEEILQQRISDLQQAEKNFTTDEKLSMLKRIRYKLQH
jgi:hypothetical protein